MSGSVNRNAGGCTDLTNDSNRLIMPGIVVRLVENQNGIHTACRIGKRKLHRVIADHGVVRKTSCRLSILQINACNKFLQCLFHSVLRPS